jgi:hypothetical protein
MNGVRSHKLRPAPRVGVSDVDFSNGTHRPLLPSPQQNLGIDAFAGLRRPPSPRRETEHAFPALPVASPSRRRSERNAFVLSLVRSIALSAAQPGFQRGHIFPLVFTGRSPVAFTIRHIVSVVVVGRLRNASAGCIFDDSCRMASSTIRAADLDMRR